MSIPAVANHYQPSAAAPAANAQAQGGRRHSAVAGVFRARAQAAAHPAMEPLNERDIAELSLEPPVRYTTPEGYRMVHEEMTEMEDGLQVVTRTFSKKSVKGKGKEALMTRNYVVFKGNEYLAFPDKHQIKHIPSTALDGLKNKKFLAQTKDGNAALFYPAEVREGKIVDLVLESVKNWVRQGAQKSSMIYLARQIGGDNGVETDCVEIYNEDPMGVHIRPKSYDLLSLKKADKKVIDEMAQRGVIVDIA